MAVLHPLTEGGSNGVVSDSRQGGPVLELRVSLNTSPFKTACVKPHQKRGNLKIFRDDLSIRIGLGRRKWIWCHVAVMLELILDSCL